jgi:hypothetical protein
VKYGTLSSVCSRHPPAKEGQDSDERQCYSGSTDSSPVELVTTLPLETTVSSEIEHSLEVENPSEVESQSETGDPLETTVLSSTENSFKLNCYTIMDKSSNILKQINAAPEYPDIADVQFGCGMSSPGVLTLTLLKSNRTLAAILY